MMLAAHDFTLSRRLDSITLALRRGEVTAICGPNGAGKSSLLACLAGLLQAGRDAVTLDGKPIERIDPRRRARAIGYLPQSAELAWDLSVETLAGLGRLPWNTGTVADEAAVEAAILAMELGALRQRPVSQLSGGEKARALLARVLAGTPRWLLADEPLANLDLAHQLTLLARFRVLAEEGLGVVLVLHDLAHAINHADRVVVLQGGRVVADGPPEQALAEENLTKVWGVEARWLGEPGRRALAVR